MTKSMARQTRASRFARDRRGNFGMMTAIVLPIILATAGVAIDLTNMVMTKAELQDATDAAALAAASAMANDGKTEAQAKELAMRFLKAQVGSKAGSVGIDEDEGDDDDLGAGAGSGTSIKIKETPLAGSGKSFSVNVATSYTLQFNAFTRLLGQTSTTMKATSSAESATESKNALSMYLVLDKSGSMAWITNEKNLLLPACINWTEANWGRVVLPTSPCYISKMAALKTAVAGLFAQFTLADPTNTFVRTGAIAYDSDPETPSPLTWGSVGALAYVNLLNAEGATASGKAMKTAYDKLKETSENTAHKTKNGQVPTKYIVFMTDGANNSSSDDTSTKQTCDKAKTDGIEVYSVAFMAPTAGQTLLKYCATTSAHYFQAENMATLIAAFKAIGERTSAVVSRLTK